MRRWEQGLALLLCSCACAWAAPTCQQSGAKPNVILITIDTLRADHLGAYGYKTGATPTLDALAKEAVVFDDAVVQVPLTFPSHAAILTGTQPFKNGVRDFTSPPLDQRWTNVAEAFHACGYTTGAVVSSFVLERSWGLARGFDEYDDGFGAQQFATKNLALVERPAGASVDRALAWLRLHRTKPLFLWLHLYDPHSPYRPPEPFLTHFREHAYDGEIAYVDSQLQRLFTYLKQSRLYDGTALVVTSDHGESLGEHGEKEHGFFIYRSTTHVPLIVKAPTAAHAEPRRTEAAVQSVDIAPTLLRLAHIHSSIEAQFDGRALPLTIEPDEQPAYCESMYPLSSFGWSPLTGLQTSVTQFIQAPRAELYDLGQDSDELNNIAAAKPALASSSAAKLNEFTRGASNPQEGATTRDPASIAKLQALGYLAFSAPAKNPQDAALADPKDKIGELETILSAQDAMQLGDYARVESLLAEVEKNEPELYLLPFMRAEAKMRQQQWANAAAFFAEALKRNPQFEQALTGLATAYQRQGKNEDAAKVLDAALKERPTSFRLWYQLGLVRMKEAPLEAENDFRKAIELQPNFGYSYRDLGLFLAGQKRYSDAIVAIEKAKTLGVQDAPMLNMLGICYRQQQKLQQAIAAYRGALQIDPQLAEAHLNLGLALEQSKQPAAAAKEYKAACQLKSALCRYAVR